MLLQKLVLGNTYNTLLKFYNLQQPFLIQKLILFPKLNGKVNSRTV